MNQPTNPVTEGVNLAQAPVAASGSTVQAQATVATVVPADTAPKKTGAASFLDDDEPSQGQGEGDSNDLELSPEVDAELASVFGADSNDGSVEDSGDGDAGESSVDLSALESLSIEEDTNAVVEVCKKKCLECKALVPWAEKTYKSCHFSSGNDNCPAKSIQIRTRIPFEEILPRFFAAEERNDSAFMLSFYERLAKKELWQQEAIQEAIKVERARRAQRQA